MCIKDIHFRRKRGTPLIDYAIRVTRKISVHATAPLGYGELVKRATASFGNVPVGHGSIRHHQQRSVSGDFSLFKRYEWLVSN